MPGIRQGRKGVTVKHREFLCGEGVLYILLMVMVTRVYPRDKMSLDYMLKKRVHAKIDEL